MKRIRLVATVLAITAAVTTLAAPTSAVAAHHPHSFGLGVVLGEPTGLSAKYRMNATDAVDFGLAYNFDNYMDIFADYLYHFPGVFGASNAFVANLTPYIGIGAAFFSASPRVVGGGGAGLGIRIPLGLEWRPAHPPLGIFLELVPGMGLIPGTFGFLNGGIGIRFYF